ncbi:MAG: TIGR02391 family protein [bacterium]|nr:TIGR02391 family protein [bacterium]
MELELKEILHQRIKDNCMPLYDDGHFSHAAFESMQQVEVAIKEKAGTENLSAHKSIEYAFGSEIKAIKLKIPFGKERQEKAQKLFESIFSFYRNPLAHEKCEIDKVICVRIMVIASELLDLIDASPISLAEIGGIEGLIKKGIFKNELQLSELLSFLSTQNLPWETFDGMFEDLAKIGYSDNQYQAIFDLGLIEYSSELMEEDDELDAYLELHSGVDMIGHFKLTKEGQGVLKKIQSSSKN